VTKQWTTKLPYIANVFSELYKIMVKKLLSYVLGGSIASISLPALDNLNHGLHSSDRNCGSVMFI